MLIANRQITEEMPAETRIVFMGTPDFAVASLKALLDAGKNIVAVVTAPDKPAGRGQKLQASSVKKFAVENGLPVMQPEKLRDPQFIDELSSYHADLQVIVAFRMLPKIVWDMPPMGTVNLHASLLPNYRGAAPINHAIINGEKMTGVTTFLLRHEIDTGNVLFSEKVAIDDEDTAGILHDKLMMTGAQLLVRTVDAIENGTAEAIPQDELVQGELKHAPKIFKEDCQIDWQQPVTDIYNLIRGLSPHPTAFTSLDGKTLKIYKSKIVAEIPQSPPGHYESDGKTSLRFAASDGYIEVIELQLEGKKRMTTEEFLRGYRLRK